MKFNFTKHKRSRSISALGIALLLSVSCAAFTACDTDDTTDNTTTKTDNCVIANGNFEYYTDDDSLKLIVSPSGWTKSVDSLLGSSATASTMESGIVNTEKAHWTSMTEASKPFDFEQYNKGSYYDVKAAMTAAKKVWSDMSVNDRLKFYEDVENALDDYNEEKDASLSLSDFYYYSDYTYSVDWNDIPGSEYADEEEEKTVVNPGTHYGYSVYDESTDSYRWEDKDGNKLEGIETPASENGVLMLNNYRTDGNGTAQKYTSSTTVTLEPGTAAELSVWVKTQNLTYNNGQDVTANRGAYIGVTHSVGGQALDQLQIKNINTESDSLKDEAAKNNGWVQYTVYLQACPYATSTFTVVLGLGQGSTAQKFEYTQGYAFFDDVELTTKAAIDYDFEEMFDGDEGVCYINTEERTFAVDTDEYKDRFEYLLDLSDSYANDWSLGNVSQEIGLTYTEVNGVKYSVAKGENGYTVYKSLGDEIDTTYDIAEFTNYNQLAAVVSENSYLQSVWEDDFASFPFDDMKGSDMLMLFSANGAPYTATLKSNAFLLGPDDYYLFSFWLKTSDTSGFTGANVTLYDEKSLATTSLGSVNTTLLTTVDIDDREDIYDGWVQCFFFIANETEIDQSFYLQFTYGPTTITDTDKYSYGEGYAAFTGFEYSKISSFEYAYAGSTTESVSASLTGLVSSANGFSSIAAMDEENIKDNLVNPSGYYGVYGGGIYTTGEKTEEDDPKYEKINANSNAGILDKNYFETYWENRGKNKEEYQWLDGVAGHLSVTDAMAAWSGIFGDTSSSRPLLIYNAVEESYGYVSSSYNTLSTSGYNAISVRVKVSAGAKAYIYLINMEDPFSEDFNKVHSMSTVGVTYWYDDNGNICDLNPADDDFSAKTNTAFYLNDNGLYTVNPDSAWAKANASNADTSIYYANLSNYEIDETTKNLLVNTDSSGKAIVTYDYSDDYVDDGIAFYYNEGAYYADEDCTIKVSNFPTAFTANYARYINVKQLDQNGTLGGVELGKNVYVTGNVTSTLKHRGVETCIVVDGTEKIAGKWVTVSFYVKTGDESFPYRLEVFSGSRDGSDKNPDGSYVLFDECNSPDLSSNYDSLLSEAIDDLKESEGLEKDPDTGRLVDAEGKAYSGADYYCYTFYDDPDFQRYDASLDENDAGNPYSGYIQSSYTETLTYLYYEKEVSGEEYSYTMFLDYSPMYQTVTADESIADEDTESDNEWWTDSDFWLMFSSIALAVVLIIVMIAMAITKMVRTARKKKLAQNDNRYDAKRRRYIRRLNLQTEEEETDSDFESSDTQSEKKPKNKFEDPYQD